MNKRSAWGHVRWSDAEIADLAAAHAGGSMSRFFARWVDSTEMLAPPDRLLAGLPSAETPPARSRGLGALAAIFELVLGPAAFTR
jgi:hypothetical protein